MTLTLIGMIEISFHKFSRTMFSAKDGEPKASRGEQRTVDAFFAALSWSNRLGESFYLDGGRAGSLPKTIASPFPLVADSSLTRRLEERFSSEKRRVVLQAGSAPPAPFATWRQKDGKPWGPALPRKRSTESKRWLSRSQRNKPESRRS
jgi:hypothetical protein